jgi:hypothetical protein
MSVYRTQILQWPEITAVGGDLVFDTSTQKRSGTTPNFVWTEVHNGHRSVTINYLTVKQINDDPANNTRAKKKAAFEALVTAMATAWLLDMADEAATMFGDWYQGQVLPIDIVIRNVP